MGKNVYADLPESPASVTARVVSDKGFHLLFTLRDTSGTELLNKFEAFQKSILARGWSPEQGNGSQNSFKPRLYQTQPRLMDGGEKTTCAKCGAPATRKTGYRKDKTAWEGVFCSTGDETHKMWVK